MKKLLAGVALTVLASPAAHANGWSGDEMLTMEANEHGPIVRVKSHHYQTISCGCRLQYGAAVNHARRTCHRQVVHRVAPAPKPVAYQVVVRPPMPVVQHKVLPAPPPAYNRTARVVSERVYTQTVSRYPHTVCPLR